MDPRPGWQPPEVWHSLVLMMALAGLFADHKHSITDVQENKRREFSSRIKEVKIIQRNMTSKMLSWKEIASSDAGITSQYKEGSEGPSSRVGRVGSGVSEGPEFWAGVAVRDRAGRMADSRRQVRVLWRRLTVELRKLTIFFLEESGM